jgi:hypothetical protein
VGKSQFGRREKKPSTLSTLWLALYLKNDGKRIAALVQIEESVA